jgi:hypothetical protein
MPEVLSVSESFVGLVSKLEACCDDGIDCGRCPVAAECTAGWDVVCQQQDEEEYAKFAARLTKLREDKWSLSAGIRERERTDA